VRQAGASYLAQWMEDPTKVYMGFALVLMVLAGTSVAHSLIWDWRAT
jgi:hypothetical protein